MMFAKSPDEYWETESGKTVFVYKSSPAYNKNPAGVWQCHASIFCNQSLIAKECCMTERGMKERGMKGLDNVV